MPNSFRQRSRKKSNQATKPEEGEVRCGQKKFHGISLSARPQSVHSAQTSQTWKQKGKAKTNVIIVRHRKEAYFKHLWDQASPSCKPGQPDYSRIATGCRLFEGLQKACGPMVGLAMLCMVLLENSTVLISPRCWNSRVGSAKSQRPGNHRQSKL